MPTRSCSSSSTAGTRSPSSCARPSSALARPGPPRLARLLSELAERGLLLSGVGAAEADPQPRPDRCNGSSAPREMTWAGAAGAVRAALPARRLASVHGRPRWRRSRCSIVAGLVGVSLSRRRRATGRRSSSRRRSASVALVFLLGRFAVVAVHETAHGLAMVALRTAGAQGWPEAAADLPVRVRGHVRGVVRAEAPSDRDQRGRAGLRPVARAPCSRSSAWRCPPGPCATSSSSSPSPPTSGRSST